MKRFEIPDRTSLVAVGSILLGFTVSSVIYPVGYAGDRHRGWDADAADRAGTRPLPAPAYDASTERLSRPSDLHLLPDTRDRALVRAEGPARYGDASTTRWPEEQLARRDDSLLPVLRTLLLEDGDPRVRAEAAFSLRRLHDTDAVPALARALLNDPVAGVRAQAAGALAAVGDERALGSVIEAALTDADPTVRGEAVTAIGRLRLDAGVVPLAVVLGKDTEDDVRRRAAIALGQIKHPSGLASLHGAMLNDASGEVRRDATRSWTGIQRHVGWRR